MLMQTPYIDIYNGNNTIYCVVGACPPVHTVLFGFGSSSRWLFPGVKRVRRRGTAFFYVVVIVVILCENSVLRALLESVPSSALNFYRKIL